MGMSILLEWIFFGGGVLFAWHEQAGCGVSIVDVQVWLGGWMGGSFGNCFEVA